jgi:hypothetical protein
MYSWGSCIRSAAGKGRKITDFFIYIYIYYKLFTELQMLSWQSQNRTRSSVVIIFLNFFNLPFRREHRKFLRLYRKGTLMLKELHLQNISSIFPIPPFSLTRQRKMIIFFESLPQELQPSLRFYVAFLNPSGEYQKYLEVTSHRPLPFNLTSLIVCNLTILQPEVKLSSTINYAPSNKGMW